MTTTSGANISVKPAFDLNSLNQVKASDQGYEFEFISESYGATGIYFSVLGEQSNVVKEWVRKKVNQKRTQDLMRQKKGKEAIVEFEQDERESRESAAIRLTGWRGLYKDLSVASPEPLEFNFENALNLVSINDEIFQAIIKNSGEVSNFTKAKPIV